MKAWLVGLLLLGGCQTPQPAVIERIDITYVPGIPVAPSLSALRDQRHQQEDFGPWVLLIAGLFGLGAWIQWGRR